MSRILALALAAAAATATVTAAPRPAGADCAMFGLTPRVVNGKTAALVDGEGGLVVAAVSTHASEIPMGDVTVQKGWMFDVRGKRTAATVEQLAPGLSVYRLPSPPSDLPLRDEKGASLGTLRRGVAGAPRLAAPKVQKIEHVSVHGRRSASHVAVTLDGDPPADALVMVLADATGLPRSWSLVDHASATKQTQIPFATRDCVVLPNGTRETKANDKVLVYWIDAAGRRSNATKAVTVGLP
ncbi:MAG: hypothetical protein KF773_36380 [Deltaproteobacteria bacterium]|nr:hypothetical protein [Deltaproteobacteria bacterium]